MATHLILVIALAALLYPANMAIPEALDIQYETWPGEFGAPCTTQTDRREGTCYLELREASWMKK